MSDTPHELSEEFPEFRGRIHDLKVVNPHFRKLQDEYHAVNREIHRGETNIEPMDDFRLEVLRKQRLKLKDELYGMLRG
jgi:uncharacterized protein